MLPELLPLPTFVEGDRVRVRPYRRGDGAALFAAIDEDRPHLRAWLPWVDAHKTVSDSEVYARKAHAWWILREDLPVLVESRDGALLGGSGLHRFDWANGSFEIGYWIRKSREGAGFVTEATTLVAAIAFERLGATRVEIRCDIGNLRSAAVPTRLGFVREGVLREPQIDSAANTNTRELMVFSIDIDGFRAAPWSGAARAYVGAADALG